MTALVIIAVAAFAALFLEDIMRAIDAGRAWRVQREVDRVEDSRDPSGWVRGL